MMNLRQIFFPRHEFEFESPLSVAEAKARIESEIVSVPRWLPFWRTSKKFYGKIEGREFRLWSAQVGRATDQPSLRGRLAECEGGTRVTGRAHQTGYNGWFSIFWLGGVWAFAAIGWNYAIATGDFSTALFLSFFAVGGTAFVFFLLRFIFCNGVDTCEEDLRYLLRESITSRRQV